MFQSLAEKKIQIIIKWRSITINSKMNGPKGRILRWMLTGYPENRFRNLYLSKLIIHNRMIFTNGHLLWSK